ncbi:Rho-like small GTPase, putative [Aspergillus fumigatus A1163]|uniref:Rho-like small GTPase, putative n=2 Tax=Aspergillus fumigatus TaxID=746128 RepID=Q4WYK3_ASPFU|nr:Rho-like small GTPase, putative [Aspergillus fumigatus Af293]EAL92250.1 Rho-like small GTPase, putative [Aspergillus fumigatus Af293]EDP52421.1 Rho-like small GTPase, putative [Aspergillus fumigatus A1163]KEY77731.1 Rho small GTPase [Aspergillus fumigatus]
MESPQDHKEVVTILLLGDPGCGKSTFLSAIKNIQARPRAETSYVPRRQLELLRDSDQPFLFDIRFSKKSFTLELYDTSSPDQHWSTLKPDVVLLAFDISNRETLDGLKKHGTGERIPVMMVGLKRDLRKEGEGIIYPQESYRIAQELRCDRYAECSAATGELMAETFEDLARLAGMTTTETGGQTQGGCVVC